ncbi:MAG TPA: hypothetical protein VGI74_16405 [Streptosporangiaceae bacterium]
MTLDNDAGIDVTDITPGGLINEISEMLAQQGFDARRSDSEGSSRLTITNAPKGRCEIDIYDCGSVTCDYFPWAGERASPADIIRAVLRLLAVPQDGLADDHVELHPGITLKSVVGRAMRAKGLKVDLWLSADEIDFSVYAEVAITNPEQPGRGIVCVADDGSIWWECHVDELTGHARGIAVTLTDMLVPPVSPAGIST